MNQASEVELLMLDLINEERTSRGLNPLKINNALNETSEDHSQWMLDNNVFDHRGAGGSSSGDRIAASDYSLEGNWRTAENIGVQSLRGEPGIADDVAQVHESLMNSPGHRANILNPDLEDIGIGIEVGDFTYEGGFRGESVMITQNFGRTDAEQPVVNDTPPPVPDEPESAPTPDPETPTAEAPANEPAPEPDMPAEDPAPEAPEMANDTPEPDMPPASEPEPADMPEPPMPDMPEANDETDMVDMPTDDMFGCGAFDDMFMFGDMPTAEPTNDDMVFAFTGTIATSDGTTTTNDPAEFSTLMADIFADFGFSFGGFDTEWM